MTHTILFVDSDENVINGFKRLLRKERSRWQTYFVNTAAEAIGLLQSMPVDLLVADIMMPDMKGDQLFQRAAEKFPSTIRIVLSGYTDDAAFKTAINVSHQYLTKPCTPELLKETICQVLSIQECMCNNKLCELIGDINQLPSLPKVYRELQREMSKESSNAHTIASIFSKDPSLSAKLLQVINSPYFGIQRKISNLDEAICIIGTRRLSYIVLNDFVHSTFKVENTQFLGHLDYLAKDSLRTAELARQISLKERQSEDRPDQAYLGGLLHNLGLLIFMSKLPDQFAKLVETVNQSDDAVDEIERRIIGFTHSEAGAYILGLWKIPPRIIESILYQYHPMKTNYDGMNALTAVHVATALHNPPVAPKFSRLFTLQLDLEYLERVGKLERLPVWEQMLGKLKQSTNDSHG